MLDNRGGLERKAIITEMITRDTRGFHEMGPAITVDGYIYHTLRDQEG
jgi:hypothetical protein